MEKTVKGIKVIWIDPDFTDKHFTGIRFDDRDFKSGDEVPCSYDWTKTDDPTYDGSLEDARLDGTCAIGVDVHWDDEDEMKADIVEALNESDGPYPREHVYLIAGSGTTDDLANDEGEVIISDAVVYGEIELITD